jgi:hypothetical protein
MLVLIINPVAQVSFHKIGYAWSYIIVITTYIIGTTTHTVVTATCVIVSTRYTCILIIIIPRIIKNQLYWLKDNHMT